MVRVHKRNKRTRLRGSRSAGTGFRKKKKGGLGNNGGQGMSGSLGQKQQFAQRIAKSHGFEKYFGRRGFTSAPTAKKRTEQINLDDLKANYFQKDGQKIELKEHKILGEGDGFKAEIHAKSASKSAIEKMEKAGGKIIIEENKTSEKSEEKTEVKKVEKKETKKEVEVKPKSQKKAPSKK